MISVYEMEHYKNKTSICTPISVDVIEDALVRIHDSLESQLLHLFQMEEMHRLAIYAELNKLTQHDKLYCSNRDLLKNTQSVNENCIVLNCVFLSGNKPFPQMVTSITVSETIFIHKLRYYLFQSLLELCSFIPSEFKTINSIEQMSESMIRALPSYLLYCLPDNYILFINGRKICDNNVANHKNASINQSLRDLNLKNYDNIQIYSTTIDSLSIPS